MKYCNIEKEALFLLARHFKHNLITTHNTIINTWLSTQEDQSQTQPHETLDDDTLEDRL